MQEKEGQASVTHADDHVIMRVWCMRLKEHMRSWFAGVQRGMRCVFEVRVMQRACMMTIAGRPQQRREMDGAVAASWAWMRSRVQSSLCLRMIHLMSSRLWPGGAAPRRLPMSFPSEPFWVPLFTPPCFIHT